MKHIAIGALLAALLLPLAGCGDDPHAPKDFGLGRLGTDDRHPNTERASTAPYTPTADELRGMRDMQYYYADQSDVLRLMGHPMEIVRDGSTETWTYPWGDSCTVVFEEGYVETINYSGPGASDNE
jgi:hypothetical protein